MRTDILKTLKGYAPDLLKVAEDFRQYSIDIRIRSFVEGQICEG